MSLKTTALSFPQVIAHRGLSSEAPENTLASIALAAEKGMKWVEVDVKLTVDGVFILCHDATLDRTTDGTGKISDLHSKDILTVDAGSWFSTKYKGEKIPRLEDVLQLCKKLKLGINLELKPDPVNIKNFAKAIVPMILTFQQQAVQILVSSFNKQILLDVYRLNHSIPLGFLIQKTDTQAIIASFSNEIQCVSIHLADRRISEKLIKKIKPLNKSILVYTVNDAKRARKLFSMGVEAVFSDVLLTFNQKSAE